MRSQILLAAFIVAGPAFAWELRTDSAGDLVKWPTTVVMTLDAKALDELPHGAEEAVRAAFANLDEATPFLDVQVKVGAAKPIGYVQGEENTNSIVALDDWPYSSGALAVTLVTLNARTNEILDADVAFNLEQHHFKVLPVPTRGDDRQFDDVQNTFTHELGHVLGLMHNAGQSDLVMYPSATPGEITKRTLKQDDRDGLLSLYGTAPLAPAEPEPQFGCSATGSLTAWALLALVPLLLRRRAPVSVPVRARRALPLILALAPAFALAAEPAENARALMTIERASDVAVVEVTARQSTFHPKYPGLIITTLTLSPRECLKGGCPQMESMVVPGGRVGDLEQYVAHEPVPGQGEQLVVCRGAGRLQILRGDADLRVRVIEGLRARSLTTRVQGSPQPSATQTPATTP
ncbi:MAG: matrixin family metalloprotease [Myxococcota bacterium]